MKSFKTKAIRRISKKAQLTPTLKQIQPLVKRLPRTEKMKKIPTTWMFHLGNKKKINNMIQLSLGSQIFRIRINQINIKKMMQVEMNSLCY